MQSAVRLYGRQRNHIVRQLLENYIAMKKCFGWGSLILKRHMSGYLTRWSCER